MVDFIRSDLPKIGPGLGPRNKIWTKVKEKIIFENKTAEINSIEYDMLNLLATGKRWLEMVPSEWIDIYGALFAESKYFVIDPHERSKIDKDVNRTFSLFTRNARLLRLQFKINMTGYAKALQTVLMAASHERGYCQGVNFLAAVFLLYEANEKDSFTLLSFLLKQRYIEILFNPKCSSLLEYMNYFEKRLRVHNKRVYKHFKAVDFSPICYAVEWFTTCFIVTCPGELSSCVLDLLLIGFNDIMIRVGLAMLDHLEERLLLLNLESLQLQFKAMTGEADPYDVMFRALTITVASNTRQNILETMAGNIESMNPKAELINTVRGANGLVDEASTSLISNHMADKIVKDAAGRPLSTSTSATGSTDHGVDHLDALAAYLSLADDEQCAANELTVRQRNRRSDLMFKLSSSTSSRIQPVSTVSEKSCSGSSRKTWTGKEKKKGSKRKKHSDRSQRVLKLISRSLTTDSITAQALRRNNDSTNKEIARVRRPGRVEVLLSPTFEALIPLRRLPHQRDGAVANDLSDWDWDLVTDGHKRQIAAVPVAKKVTHPRPSIFSLHLVAHGGRTKKEKSKQNSLPPAAPVMEAPHLRHASRSHLVYGNIFDKTSLSSAVRIPPRVVSTNATPNPSDISAAPVSLRKVGSSGHLAGPMWFDKLVKDTLWLSTLGGLVGAPSTASATSVSKKSVDPSFSSEVIQTGACISPTGYQADSDCSPLNTKRKNVEKAVSRPRRHQGKAASRSVQSKSSSSKDNVTIFESGGGGIGGDESDDGDSKVDLVGAMSEDWFGKETRSEKTRLQTVAVVKEVNAKVQRVPSERNRTVRARRNKRRSFRRKFPHLTSRKRPESPEL